MALRSVYTDAVAVAVAVIVWRLNADKTRRNERDNFCNLIDAIPVNVWTYPFIFSWGMLMHWKWVTLITMRQSVIFMFVYHAQGIKITKALESVNILRHTDICCYNLYYYYLCVCVYGCMFFRSISCSISVSFLCVSIFLFFFQFLCLFVMFYCTINSVVIPIFGWIFYVFVL